MHHDYIDQFLAKQNRYSAKNMAKPVPFFCYAPELLLHRQHPVTAQKRVYLSFRRAEVLNRQNKELQLDSDERLVGFSENIATAARGFSFPIPTRLTFSYPLRSQASLVPRSPRLLRSNS